MEKEQINPLKNITVIDCSVLIAGPMAARILGDYGATVIKIEHPDSGDIRRSNGAEEGLAWKLTGRNKKSVPIDMSTEEGQDLLRTFTEEADVLIESFRPRTLENWNLGWNTLSKINPKLVMARISGFGQTGPYKDRPGFGTVAEAMSTFSYINRFPDQPPTLPRNPLADSVAALHTVYSIMIALYWVNSEGGSGQYIDISLLESLFNIIGEEAVDFGTVGDKWEPLGNRSTNYAPRNSYKTKDGEWIAISCATENTASRLLNTIGGEKLNNDERFKDNRNRIKYSDILDEIIQDWTIQYERNELLDVFETAEIPHAPVYDIEDFFNDPHIRARNTLIEVSDKDYESVVMPGIHPTFSETPGEVQHTGPDLGKHTVDTIQKFTDLGLEEIQTLNEKGIIKIEDSDLNISKEK